MGDRMYRKLTISDLPLLVQMKNDSPDFWVCEENARQFLNNPMNWFFACIEEGRVIGHAFGYELNNFYNSGGNKLYIHGFGVLPHYRQQGIGTKILAGIKETCRLLSIYKIFLITEKSNIAACACYEKSGGKIDSDSKDDARVYYFNPLT